MTFVSSKAPSCCRLVLVVVCVGLAAATPPPTGAQTSAGTGDYIPLGAQVGRNLSGDDNTSLHLPLSEPGSPVVRLIYLVPSDREVRPAYASAIELAARTLKWWFYQQLGSTVTFRLDYPAVQTLMSNQPASWYRQPRTPSSGASDFFFNVSAHGFSLLGGRRPSDIYVFYVDADPACGQYGGAGGGGLVVISANDLRGLTGEQNIPGCPGDPPDLHGVNRWIGGLGHEIGHAAGLPHPPGCDAGLPTCDGGALMWAGYGAFPNTYLRTQEIAALRSSPYFVATSPPVPPFGNFDTPADGAIVVGEVAVTGWVLDDDRVVQVSIYRNPAPNEAVQPNGLVFVGDATFVAGARPDVAGLYPVNPLRDRAGWGYMLLSNMLPPAPPSGFQFSAFARDSDGVQTPLGTRTMHLANSTSQLPFGTIDTPAQGATVSGIVANFGWVLTPGPNMIPLDGSTIDVYIDNQFVGHPTYNLFRGDIAGTFPGYANTNGAVGLFEFDSTTLADGVHTISWVATDTGGNAQGLGSRYFTVSNTAATQVTLSTDSTAPGTTNATLRTGKIVEFNGMNDASTPSGAAGRRTR